MHWFWRALVCLAAGAATATMFMHFGSRPGLLQSALGSLYALLGGKPAGGPGWQYPISLVIVLVLPALVTTMGLYDALIRRYYLDRLQTAETRCRKCGYILRGISEPRCPECGERI